MHDSDSNNECGRSQHKNQANADPYTDGNTRVGCRIGIIDKSVRRFDGADHAMPSVPWKAP